MAGGGVRLALEREKAPRPCVTAQNQKRGRADGGSMIEKRCQFCNKLLFRVSEEPRERIEVKCPRSRCKRLNTFGLVAEGQCTKKALKAA
jgi:phage FluMu protein Com